MSADEIIEATLYHGHIPTIDEISIVLSELTKAETKWRDRSEMLDKEGYTLRSRLRPGWTPSWLESGNHPMACEDGERLWAPSHLVDATDKGSGQMVCIKEIRAGSEEHRIVDILRQREWTSDPQNHCVQVLNILKDPQDPGLLYLVMPFLRSMVNPPFEQVKEIIEFTDQILEGLTFLHEKGIAHRDCVRPNIMMDGDAMYPQGFHPIITSQAPDYIHAAQHTSRTVAGAKYYFVDFGISCYFPDVDSPRLVTGSDGRDQEPPELSDTKPYDPFKLDVFIIGNMLQREFCQTFSNLEFLKPLIQEMTRHNPKDRPSATEAFALWKGIRDTVWTTSREWRPRPRRERPVETILLDSVCMGNLLLFVAKNFVERLPV